MKLDILAIGVHPDDVELACSGTLLHHIALGHKVGLLDLTRGELGTRGNAEIRSEEAAEAAKMLGAVGRGQLAMPDGFFELSQENKLAIVRVIRYFQPDIILANAVSDRHPDHGRAAKLVDDACFLAGLTKVETHWEDQKQTRWRPKVVYHYIQDHNLRPDFVFDITPYIDRKMEIIQAYKSQFFDPKSEEPKTPISGADFMQFIRAKAAVYGREAGFEYGEGFTVNRPVGVDNLLDLK